MSNYGGTDSLSSYLGLNQLYHPHILSLDTPSGGTKCTTFPSVIVAICTCCLRPVKVFGLCTK